MVWELLEGPAMSVKIELSWKISSSVMRTIDSEIPGFGAVWVVRTVFSEISLVVDVDLWVLCLGVDPSSGSILWEFPVVTGTGLELELSTSVVCPSPRAVV